jgi:ubiquinone/menaquinone biosynthesis C-methylase UbiE
VSRHTWSVRLGSLVVVTLFVTAAAAAGQGGSTIPTERIFEALAVGEGMTVCEMGAGDGELTIAAAKLVGSTGRVYTSELGDARVKTLRDRTAATGLPHITVVEGAAEKTNFPAGACDALFMRNVYHHFAEPAAINLSIAASLKPDGRLAVVDFTPPNKEAERAADRSKDGMHGISAASVSRELTAAGFEVVSSEAGGQRWFMVVAKRTASRR